MQSALERRMKSIRRELLFPFPPVWLPARYQQPQPHTATATHTHTHTHTHFQTERRGDFSCLENGAHTLAHTHTGRCQDLCKMFLFWLFPTDRLLHTSAQNHGSQRYARDLPFASLFTCVDPHLPGLRRTNRLRLQRYRSGARPRCMHVI